ncbi:MAG: hypothetical protein NTZ17_08100 [Phycisphaerae bacterium]|nr:hypothetical protein [Phycisphaerae bacterium]
MSRPLAEIGWRHSVRLCVGSLLIGLLCAVAWPEQAVRESFEVGQRWEYRHQGPRPGDMEPNVIDGERIMRVISVAEGQEGRQWVIEERFTNSKNVIGRVHVNQEQMLTLLEIENKKGEVARLRYDPAIPYRLLDLAPGQKREIETTLKMDSVEFSLPSTITIERLEDETVTTPAGEFAGCRHYRTTTTSTMNIKIAKIPMTEEREQWYHGSVHGMVKEVYRKGPVKFLTWSREGYTATSELTALGKEEVKTAPEPATDADTKDRRRDEPDTPAPKPASHTKSVLVSLGAIAVLALGGLTWAKRTGRK